MLKKHKGIEIEFSPVYFNSTTTTVIKSQFGLDKSSKETLFRIENWIKEGSGWIVESIDFQYINISTFWPLSWSSYIKLPVQLKNPKKKKSRLTLKTATTKNNVFFGVILDI